MLDTQFLEGPPIPGGKVDTEQYNQMVRGNIAPEGPDVHPWDENENCIEELKRSLGISDKHLQHISTEPFKLKPNYSPQQVYSIFREDRNYLNSIPTFWENMEEKIEEEEHERRSRLTPDQARVLVYRELISKLRSESRTLESAEKFYVLYRDVFKNGRLKAPSKFNYLSFLDKFERTLKREHTKSFIRLPGEERLLSLER